MVQVTIVGAGVQGTRIAEKYKKFPSASLKAVVSRHKPASAVFSGVSFFRSARSWKDKFGAPSSSDVFDLCVHQDTLLKVLNELVAIGAKNFILPKPLALSTEESTQLQILVSRHKLNVLVASQWHYASLVEEIREFVSKHSDEIASARIVFSRTFSSERKAAYTAATAFLPHMVQILFDTGLHERRATVQISQWSDQSIRLAYCGKATITLESDLTAPQKTEILELFLKGKKTPALRADFAGVQNGRGFTVYPSLTVAGKKRHIQEDVLEKMIAVSLPHFEGKNGRKALTFSRYLPVANEVVRLIERANRLIVVVGGGIFGTLAALEIAKKGHPVVLLEKAPELLTGASLVNQCRVHMGYHYPRDEHTARESRKAKRQFEARFRPAIRKALDNHYLVAKEGSLTTSEKFISFCKKMGLPYEESWPRRTKMAKDKFALSLKVPETIFDAHTIREMLSKRVAETPAVALLTSAEVTGITRGANSFMVTYDHGGATRTLCASGVVNASYGNTNRINNLAGLATKQYQYELCEVPVVKTPWPGVGWSIIDGPFFGIMPFGSRKDHLFYDVELSVLERVVGPLPEFAHDVDYYNDPKRVAARFRKYQEKWGPWLPDVKKCKHLYSMYATRIVLAHRDKTDARPTMVNELAPGFWQLFSGKVTTSVPLAIELGGQVDAYLKKK